MFIRLKKCVILNRLPGQDERLQIAFIQRWLTSHWTDSRTILKKPLIFAEFGKSKTYPGFNISAMDYFLNIVYTNIYNLAKNGGTMGGGLVWQIFTEGMESYYDGYEIVLSQNPSATSIIAQQSNKMTKLEHSLNNPHGDIFEQAKRRSTWWAIIKYMNEKNRRIWELRIKS